MGSNQVNRELRALSPLEMAAAGQQSVTALLYSIGKELTCPIWYALFLYAALLHLKPSVKC